MPWLTLAALPGPFEQGGNESEQSEQPQHGTEPDAADQSACQHKRQAERDVDQVVLKAEHSSPLGFRSFLLNGGLSGNGDQSRTDAEDPAQRQGAVECCLLYTSDAADDP